jgi:hypothetical protein
MFDENPVDAPQQGAVGVNGGAQLNPEYRLFSSI